MRKDMFEIIIERPRAGSGLYKGKNRFYNLRELNYNLSDNLDESNNSEEGGIFYGELETIRPKGRGIIRKALNENLAPLRRFLESRLGKNWDDVYSEIRENINPNSGVQKHVIDHTKQYVTTNTILLEDGRIITHTPYWNDTKEYYVVNDYSKGIDRWRFYVDPTTKELCKEGARSYRRPKHIKNPSHEIVQINKLEQYRNLPGGWFHVQLVECFQKKTAYAIEYIPTSDCVFKNQTESVNFAVEYGQKNLRAVSKRQCGTKEIKNVILPLIKDKPENYFVPKNFPAY